MTCPNILVLAKDDDVAAIVGLMNRSFRRGTGWSTEGFDLNGDRTTMDLVRADMAAKPGGSFLLWLDSAGENLHGCVWLEPLENDRWYLGSLTVDPGQQNRGAGHLLLAAAEQWISRHGGRRVRISVINVRDVLIEWYIRRGYRRTGECEPFPYGEDVRGLRQAEDISLVYFEKELTPFDG